MKRSLLVCAGSIAMFASATAPVKVTQVTLEKTPCFGACPAYKVTLKADGTILYKGISHVERIGTYQGTFWAKDFERLSALLSKLNFWKLKDRYALPVTDMPSEILTVTTNKGRKTVDEYGASGPLELWAMQRAIDGIVAGVRQWTPVK